jgi:putative FmdB family regulatory protein
MPIYAYRCETCGHEKDVIQKFSDAPLTVCPACGAEAFRKQLTAPAFQLKGSGWYVTDFRDNGKSKAAKPAAEGAEGKPAEAGKDAAPDAKPAPAAATPAAAPAAGAASSSDGGTSAGPSKPAPPAT